MKDSELISETQVDFNLIESDVNEEVLKADTIKINTLPQEILEPSEEIKIKEYKEDVIQEDNFTTSTPEVTRAVRDFHTGKVEWEFGFSS